MSDKPKRIYKYALNQPVGETLVIEMPHGAEVLSCQITLDGLHLWAVVDTRNEPEPRAFVVHPTGAHLPAAPGRHIATVVEGGLLVWHVFEVPA